MATIMLRPFGPVYRYRGEPTISEDSLTYGEPVVALAGTIDDGVYTLHVGAAAIRMPTAEVGADEYGPLAHVAEQQVAVPGGVLNVEDCGGGEALVELLHGQRHNPLHIYFEHGFYDESGEDFDTPPPGSPPPAIRRPRTT